MFPEVMWFSPVSSHGGTEGVRSGPSTASAPRWWCQSTAAWSRGSSAWFHPWLSAGLSFGSVLRLDLDCKPALLPPASFSCLLTNAGIFPLWSRPIFCWRSVSIWHQERPVDVLLSTCWWKWWTVKAQQQKHSQAAEGRHSQRVPDGRLPGPGGRRMWGPGLCCQVGSCQTWADRQQRMHECYLLRKVRKV